MLYGVITSVEKGIGVLSSKGTLYRFSLGHFPNAEVGMNVAFDPTNPYQTEKNWINKIEFISMSTEAHILKWMAEAEQRLKALEGAYELPEEFFAEHCGSEDESA